MSDSLLGDDLSALAWVHGELRRSLENAHKSLRRYLKDAEAASGGDLDVVDPNEAPGVGTPVPGGLSSAQALKIVRNLGGLNIVGMDVVEVAPSYDQSEITAIAAAHIACDMLCLLRNQKLARQG